MDSNLHTGFSHRVKVGVIHGFLGCEACLVVIAEELVQEVNCLRHRKVLVVAVDKLLPRFP